MFRLRTLSLAAAVMAVSASAVQAQTPVSCYADSTTQAGAAVGSTAAAPLCYVNTKVQASVKHILYLKLSADSTNLGTVDSAEYNKTVTAVDQDGWAFTAGPTVNIWANRPYNVKVEPVAASFTFVADANYNKAIPAPKPSSDLAIKASTAAITSASTGFTAFSGTTAQTLRTNATGEKVTLNTGYRTAWRYANDVPGDYSLSLKYTITGQ